MICIANFTVSRDLFDVKAFFDEAGKTNIDFLLDDFIIGETNWSVPKNAAPGDIVVFMCAATARQKLGLATSHIPPSYGQEFIAFVEQQKALYKKYSGYMLGCGVVATVPEHSEEDNRWYADIGQLRPFANPIGIDDFRSFITVSSTSSITYLKAEQWERLKWLVNQKNPGFFQNVIAPSAETLEEEFKDAVQKQTAKSLNQLKKEAAKKTSKPEASTVQTTVYHRDPAIAAYAKKRANGYCELCGQKAPFIDNNGVPYLECHHIEWLSMGGMDSIDNCAALCPNCHRRMHIVNDPDDIKTLKAKLLLI